MSALGRRDRLYKVDYGPSFIPNADAHRYVCYRGTPPSECGQVPSFATVRFGTSR
jgi:hypothetical protein